MIGKVPLLAFVAYKSKYFEGFLIIEMHTSGVVNIICVCPDSRASLQWRPAAQYSSLVIFLIICHRRRIVVDVKSHVGWAQLGVVGHFVLLIALSRAAPHAVLRLPTVESQTGCFPRNGC